MKTTMALRRSLLAILCGVMVAGTGLAPMSTMAVYADEHEGDEGDGGDGDEGGDGGSNETTYEEPGADEEQIRYAVQIYGIGVDTVTNGSDPDDEEFEYKAAGLTFGPAVGYVYLGRADAGREHRPTGSTENGNAHRCVHNDDWETIIEWNIEDPLVYEDCIEQGCTKSIALELDDDNAEAADTSSEKVFNSSKAHVDKDDPDNNLGTTMGAGPSVLYFELQEPARKWTNNGAHDANLNWANSRMRAMLNGAQTETKETYGGTEYNADNSMLSALPEILVKAIGYKEISYAVSSSSESTEKCYDRLWLFAANEIYSSSDLEDYTGGIYNYEGEGSQYALRTGGWSTRNSTSDWMDSSTGYRTRNTQGTAGVGFTWWLRSRVLTTFKDADYCYSATVSTTGLMHADTDNSSAGVAFGFTLSRDPDPVEPENPSAPAETPSAGETHDANAGVGSVSLYNTDTAMAQYLSGAKFALYKSNGDYVGTYTMDANGYLNIKSLDASTYYFVQLTAPEGYVLDPTYLRFELKGDQAINLVFKNARIGTVDANADGSQAVADGADADAAFSVNSDGTNAGDENGSAIDATGDDSLILLYGCVVIAAAIILAGLGRRRVN